MVCTSCLKNDKISIDIWNGVIGINILGSLNITSMSAIAFAFTFATASAFTSASAASRNDGQVNVFQRAR